MVDRGEVLSIAQAFGDSPHGSTGGPAFASQLLQSLIALLLVCVLAWWVLRWMARHSPTLPGSAGRAVHVVERTVLDARTALYVVRVGERWLLLGVAERALTLLAELRPEDLPTDLRDPRGSAPGPRFADILARVRGQTTRTADTAAARGDTELGGEKP